MKSISTILPVAVFCLATGAAAIEQSPLSIVDAPVESDISQPLDVTEDVIAYDGVPSRFFANDSLVGTVFEVRFTPEQACSLSYVTVVSYNSPGNATVHVYGDNQGQPDGDLIVPFTANLSGNISRQRINLPFPIDVGGADFHVGIEYMQTPPPYVTVDNDGGTGRSMIMRPGQSWQVIPNNDLNFRAFVRYYGRDQMPPTILSQERVLGFSEEGDHPITATVTDDSGILLAGVDYSIDGQDYLEIAMENTSGNNWIGFIPSQPVGTVVYYYIRAVDNSPDQNQAMLPPQGPSAPFVMTVVEGAELAYDDGSSENWYIVGDQWDDNRFAVRFTPPGYPVLVTGARAMVNDNTVFDFSISDDFNGQPGEMLAGPFESLRNTGDWAITFLPEDQWTTITAASFWLVFHWRQEFPGSPGVGTDANDPDFRSSWYTDSTGWNTFDDGDFIMRVIITTPTGANDLVPDGTLSKKFELTGNYPNPFNSSTEITFAAPRRGRVALDVYNIIGQKVKTLVDGVVEPGRKKITWNGANESGISVSTGIYYYRLVSEDGVSVGKMTFLK